MLFRKKCIAICSIALSSCITFPVLAQQNAVAGSAVLRMERNDRDKMPSSITFTPEAGFKDKDAKAIFSKFFELDPANDDMRFVKTDKVTAEVSIARYQQYFKGIKVEHGNYTISSRADAVQFMNGNIYKTAAGLVTAPQITEAAALAKATQHVGAKKYMWDDAEGILALQFETGTTSTTGIPEGELVFVEDYFSGDEPDGKLHLAYRFDIYAASPLSRNDVYVDAATGKILFMNSIMKHAHGEGNSLYSGRVSFVTRQTSSTSYSLHDDTRGGGIHTYTLNGGTNVNNRVEVTSNDTVWATGVAIDAHWGATKVFDYWRLKHNRLSYNGQSSPLNSYVDYDVNYNNASWSGNAMRYGNGTGRATGGFDPLVSLDICAHEIGHGVCATTAGLIYNRESGAMNEGFSDIWGAVIEHYADPLENDATAKRYWDIGEEISNNPLRSMAEPKRFGDPDTYKGINWKFASSSCTPNGNNDQCGVHSNSGVLNKWFYLLTIGGRATNDVGNGYEVLGLGFDTAGVIAYGTEVALTTTSNFAAARTASINFATAQYGACSKAVEMVTRAWYAVNVGADYVSCTPQISFPAPDQIISERANVNSCTASRIVSIPVKLNGPAPTGGNAVVTVAVTGGTAVSGIDYTLNNTTLTFPAGSTAAQNIQLTVFDNGNIADTSRYIDFALSFAANGSSATMASVLNTGRVIIENNDSGPLTGSTSTHTIGVNSGFASTTTSAFASNTAMAHTQYIVSRNELLAAGIRPNGTLSSIVFNVITKRSTQPFTDYTIRLGHTTVDEFTNSMITTGLTQVYMNNYTSTVGLNTLPFTTGFVWDGVSNIVIDICFSNGSRSLGFDDVMGTANSHARVTWTSSNSLGGAGCALPFTAANLSNNRPLIRFVQTLAPSPIETTLAATRTWGIRTNERVYFYSEADSQLIGGLFNYETPLNCVTASISKEGNGFEPASFAWIRRSRKEMTISAEDKDTVYNQVFFYLTDDELDGVAAGNLQLFKTTATTDAGINAGNMQVYATPQVIRGANYYGFRGVFTGFGRYFLVDGTPNLAVANLNGTDGMWVNNNPFKTDIAVSYKLQVAGKATVRLYDITGKVLYEAQRELQSGKQQFTIPAGSMNLAPGHYILNVVTGSGVFTNKLVKE
jgi:Zn-dependent metalloprotease